MEAGYGIGGIPLRRDKGNGHFQLVFIHDPPYAPKNSKENGMSGGRRVRKA